MLTITTTSERTGRWTKMHRPFVPFSVKESSAHTRSLADCITITSGFRFSVHTARRDKCQATSTTLLITTVVATVVAGVVATVVAIATVVAGVVATVVATTVGSPVMSARVPMVVVNLM